MVSFKKASEVLQELEKTSSRNKMTEILSEFYDKLSPKDMRTSSYLMLGTLGPKYADVKLNIGENLAIKAVCRAFEESEDKVKKMLQKKGDLGDVVYGIGSKRSKNKSVEEVFETLLKIKNASGSGSQDKKVDLLSKLLKNSSRLEGKYIMRIVLSKMRLGVAEYTILDAVTTQVKGEQEEAEEIIEDGYNKCSDIGSLAESVAKHGLEGVKRLTISLGRPVNCMLAQRVQKASEILEKISDQELAAEGKYDGERIQVHKDEQNVSIFSRRLNEITHQYPEVVEGVRKYVSAKKAVLDGEVAAYSNGKFQSFQKLMQRRRKYDVEEYREKVPVGAFFFDLLYVNGHSLLRKTYSERRKKLEKIVSENKVINLANRIVSPNFEDIRKFFKECVDRGLEGIIVKATGNDSIYQPGKRGWLWIKWKKEYAEGMQESFDLVVIGSYYGKGQRKGHFGALLCAAYNEKKNKFESFTKVGSGYSDQDFEDLSKILKDHETKEKPSDISVSKTMKPDTFYEPSVVIEVIGAEITKSPHHMAGRDSKAEGLALRFPRFLSIREDKGARDATTLKEIKAMRRN